MLSFDNLYLHVEYQPTQAIRIHPSLASMCGLDLCSAWCAGRKRGGEEEWGSCFALPAGFELISRESGTVVEAGSLDGWGCSQW